MIGGCDVKVMANKALSLYGQKYGRLTAIEPCGKSKKGEMLWRCQCDCGNEAVVIGTRLKGGYVHSCGCLKQEQRSSALKKWHKDNPHNHRTHGDTNTRLFHIWTGMRARCRSYPAWHGRGIRVCEAWDKSYEAFKAWALSNGYSDELSIDRIDNDGNYEPSNCRWATVRQQARNRRTNHLISHNGKTMTAAEWAAYYGMNYQTFLHRINYYGWTMEDIENATEMEDENENCTAEHETDE